MRYFIIIIVGIGFFTGCVKNQVATPSPNVPSVSKFTNEIQIFTLQYRISRDAVSPSKFVAIDSNGMTLGLRVNWKITEEKKKELDALLAQLEKDGVNGAEFKAKAKWIHAGFELEVYEIERKP
jgi:hypothetical protein